MHKFKQLLMEARDGMLLEKDHRKNIKKIGLSDEVADWLHGLSDKYSIWFAKQIKEKGHEKRVVAELQDRYGNIFRGIIDWIRGSAEENNHVIIKNYDLDAANQAQQEWHERIASSKLSVAKPETDPNLVGGEYEYDRYGTIETRVADKGEIIYKFDDGTYVIYIPKRVCGYEASAARHCGSAGSIPDHHIVSIRRQGDPLVTLAMLKDTFAEYSQCKGKANEPVKKEYWKYIIEFFEHIDVPIHLAGYVPATDWTILKLDYDDANKLLTGPKGDQWNKHLLSAYKTQGIKDFSVYKINDEVKQYLAHEEEKRQNKLLGVLEYNGIIIDNDERFEFDPENINENELKEWIYGILNLKDSQYLDDEPGQIGIWYKVPSKYYSDMVTGSHIFGFDFEVLKDNVLKTILVPHMTEDLISYTYNLPEPGVITGKDLKLAMIKTRGK